MGFGHCTKMSVRSTSDRYSSESSPIHQATVSSVWRWARRAVEAGRLFFHDKMVWSSPKWEFDIWVLFSQVFWDRLLAYLLCHWGYYITMLRYLKTLNSFFKQDAADMFDNISLGMTYLQYTVLPMNYLLYFARAKLPAWNPPEFYLKPFKYQIYDVSLIWNYSEIFHIVI